MPLASACPLDVVVLVVLRQPHELLGPAKEAGYGNHFRSVDAISHPPRRNCSRGVAAFAVSPSRGSASGTTRVVAALALALAPSDPDQQLVGELLAIAKGSRFRQRGRFVFVFAGVFVCVFAIGAGAGTGTSTNSTGTVFVCTKQNGPRTPIVLDRCFFVGQPDGFPKGKTRAVLVLFVGFLVVAAAGTDRRRRKEVLLVLLLAPGPPTLPLARGLAKDVVRIVRWEDRGIRFLVKGLEFLSEDPGQHRGLQQFQEFPVDVFSVRVVPVPLVEEDTSIRLVAVVGAAVGAAVAVLSFLPLEPLERLAAGSIPPVGHQVDRDLQQMEPPDLYVEGRTGPVPVAKEMHVQ
mmetsp:Transcript_12210/g.25865  ORF Transcript_12210/g.25865 Transcript_12210/m.25865 type:complete len:348 (-) Transcript_12210:80-1123(-)